MNRWARYRIGWYPGCVRRESPIMRCHKGALGYRQDLQCTLGMVENIPLMENHLIVKGNIDMRLLIALILPWLTFFTIGRPIAGIICLILQITLIGWLPATLWAVYAVSQYNTDKKIEKALGQRT